MSKRRKERRGESSSVRPSQGCCPCSLCAWGTAFASAESAAGRGKRRIGIIRDRMQLFCDCDEGGRGCLHLKIYSAYLLSGAELATLEDTTLI